MRGQVNSGERLEDEENEDFEPEKGDRIIEAEQLYHEDGRVKTESKFINLSEGGAPVKKIETTEIKIDDFPQLINYLGENNKIGDKKLVEKYKQTTDNAERLNLMRFMCTADIVRCISDCSKSPVAAAYLKDRLVFYQKLVNGQATKTEQAGDGNKANCDVLIDTTQMKPESVNLGLLRDAMYAAMQGTPEMAGIKIATNNINRRNAEIYSDKKEQGEKVSEPARIRSVVELWGYYSGINDLSIGMYEHAINLYKRCEGQIKDKLTGQEIGKEEMEHKAVLLMAKRLENANQYDGIMNKSASPYDANFNEAVIAGQLGNKVMRQMAGMRKKIKKTDFGHIDRFVGKSGDNKYEKEKNRLDSQIEFLTAADSENEKQEFTNEENSIAVNKLEKWHQAQMMRIAKKADGKGLDLMESASITESNARIGVKISIGKRGGADYVSSELNDYRQNLNKIEVECRARKEYLQNRTPEVLLADLIARKEIVDKRYEKRKSLAQKALDLHFAINHLTSDERDLIEHLHEEDKDEEADLIKPFSEIIDWINFAPLGTIKRSHRFLCQGVDHKLIIRQALEDIMLKRKNANVNHQKAPGNSSGEYDLADIAGAAQETSEDEINELKIIHDLVDKVEGGDLSAKQRLEKLLKIANILDRNGYDFGIKKVSELADKIHAPFAFANAIKFYNLNQIEQFMKSGINDYSLNGIAMARETTLKSGYDFSPDEIMEMAEDGVRDQSSITDPLIFFNREEFKNLLHNHIKPYLATMAVVTCRQYGYKPTIEQIMAIAGAEIAEEKDLSLALGNLTLDQVVELYSQEVSYGIFEIFKKNLADHQYASDFDSVVGSLKDMADSLPAESLLEQTIKDMGDVFDYYNFSDIKELVKMKSDLDDMAKIRMKLEEKNINLDFDKTLALARIAKTKFDGERSYHISRAMERFGEAGMFQLADVGCPLDVAVVVKDQIDSGQYRAKSREWKKIDAGILQKFKEMGLDAIIAIAKSGGDIESVIKAIAVGFSLEETARFPFLTSSLIDDRGSQK